MNYIKHLLLFCFSYNALGLCLAQDNKYELSKPVDLGLVGVNKVLQMKNGNTLLFHLEPSKPVTIKVFDASRKEIASREEACRYLDVSMVQDLRFKGIFETGGEAVLFFDEPGRIGRHRTLRLRFNATNGSLVEEKVIAESKSQEKRVNCFVMKNKQKDNYAVLSAVIENFRRTADLNVEYFSSKHESVRTVHIDLDRSKDDYLDVTGAEYLDSGVYVTFSLSRLIQNGTISHGHTYDSAGYIYGATPSRASHNAGFNMGINSTPLALDFVDPKSENYDEFDPTPTRFNHYLSICFVPEKGNAVRSKMVDASPDIYPYHTYLTHNSFSAAVNLLLFGYKDAYVMYGIERLPAAVMDNVLLKLDDQTMAVDFSRINNEMANVYLRQKTDTSQLFLGAPLAMFTNEYGLSTLVSESFTRYANTETAARPRLFETWLGNIAVTRFDDNGKELSGIVLPRAQYYKSYRHYYYSGQLGAKWHDHMIFDDLPEQVYTRQFLSLNTFTFGRSCYVVFNDDNGNLKNNFEKPVDSVYTFDNTDAFYYQVSSKKELTKNYLFGAPQKGEHKCGFIEGADFDEKTGVYAALVQYKRGESIGLRMAWSHLEP